MTFMIFSLLLLLTMHVYFPLSSFLSPRLFVVFVCFLFLRHYFSKFQRNCLSQFHNTSWHRKLGLSYPPIMKETRTRCCWPLTCNSYRFVDHVQCPLPKRVRISFFFFLFSFFFLKYEHFIVCLAQKLIIH